MSEFFNPLNYPIGFELPNRLVFPSAWHEHIPFAMVLMEIVKPDCFVELGTHSGNSYCAFCQAVSHLQLSTECFAIDIWEGDKHSGFYGPEILKDLKAHHDPIYGNFSTLLKTTFDLGREKFADGSIDVLHIDGLHTYEAVSHDFTSWKSKMSSNSIIIFHDTNVRVQDFGVWRLWEELKMDYPTFEFFHGNGLGVLGLGKVAKQYPFFELSEDEVYCL